MTSFMLPASAVHEAAIRDGPRAASSAMYKWLTDNPNPSSFTSFRLIRGPGGGGGQRPSAHDTYLTSRWAGSRKASARATSR